MREGIRRCWNCSRSGYGGRREQPHRWKKHAGPGKSPVLFCGLGPCIMCHACWHTVREGSANEPWLLLLVDRRNAKGCIKQTSDACCGALCSCKQCRWILCAAGRSAGTGLHQVDQQLFGVAMQLQLMWMFAVAVHRPACKPAKIATACSAVCCSRAICCAYLAGMCSHHLAVHLLQSLGVITAPAKHSMACFRACMAISLFVGLM